ncbi:MAG: hypothetical protein DME75_01575 [Verrucomicrobia bacterium]|nr:MAG: hypothetical protein DME75_01575 [Verrucomicrobiota bacterium]
MPRRVTAVKAWTCSRTGKLTSNVNATARCIIAGLTICSWIAVANHCAFAAVATKTHSAQTECPFHSKPAKQKEQPSQVQCCKVLRALALAKANSWARDDAKFSDADPYCAEHALIASPQATLAPLFLDTGPPGAHSFAELILQRSCPAHGPPARV